ncbi:MAG TPA: lysophospholipid acyltransferase family protein [Planctomycetota bacterium]|nr:lysophospholipid acyltransferase family protein [Planctomycetota bacterium]
MPRDGAAVNAVIPWASDAAVVLGLGALSWWRLRSVAPVIAAAIGLVPAMACGIRAPMSSAALAIAGLAGIAIACVEAKRRALEDDRGRSAVAVIVVLAVLWAGLSLPLDPRARTGSASMAAVGALLLSPLALAALVALALVPRLGKRPVSGWTILNSICGYGAFATACMSLPLVAPLALILPGGRVRWIAWAMRWAMHGVYAATPTVSWRCQGEVRALGGARVVVSNHEGMLDILAACTVSGTRTFLAKTWVFRAFPLGLAARAAGLRNIDILDADDYQEGAVATLGDDVGIFVFPEGTRSKDGRIGRFRPGAFVLARSLGAPVVPIAIAGSRVGICPGSMWIHPSRVVSRVLPPMAALPDESVRAFADRVRAAIARERQALLRGLLPTRHLARGRRERFLGLGGATARAIEREERVGAWRVLTRLAIGDDGDWLIAGCGWSTLLVALRQLAPASRLLAGEADPRRRAVARHAWWRDGDLIGERLDGGAVVDPVGVIALDASADGLVPLIAARSPSFIIAADIAAWRAAFPAYQVVDVVAGLTALRAPTIAEVPPVREGGR